MRKRIVVIVLTVLCGHKSNAQVDLERGLDTLFRQIKTSGLVRHSCLWDYGCTDTNLFRFQGFENKDTVGFDQWSDLYEHWNNSVMDTILKPKGKSILLNWFSVYFKRGLIAVPATLVEGACFRRNAFEEKSVFYDSIQFLLSVNNPSKAFEDRSIFIATPFVQSFYNRSPKLYFSDSFFFSNTGLKVIDIQWKLNDGLYTRAEMNIETPLALRDGVNFLSLVYFLSNGKSYRSVQKLYLYEYHASFGNEQLMTPIIGDEFRNIYTTPYRQTELQEPLGAYVEVLPGFENGKPHACISKPLIFVEGIDFGYKDHPSTCYGGKCGSIGLRDLMRGVIYNPYETKLKDILEDWEPIRKAPELIDKLRKSGYDLIYLDYHNGADYIENNAMLLVELIKRVNWVKCSNDEIVIIGASMGGLVSRFALSYMEKNGLPHCVRTFLSFDAPQNGANIPLGIQHSMKYYRKKLPGIKDKFDRKLDRAASRQMLLEHCLSENGYKEHGDRIDLVSKLDKLGNYPLNCRKIALINGSINARTQDFSPGDVLLKMNPYLGTLNFDFLKITSTVYANYAQIQGKNVVLLAQYSFHRKEVVDVPYETVQYDHVPGSKRFDLEDSRAIYILFNVINKKDASCFIPTESALGLYSKDLYKDLYTQIPMSVPSPALHPFDAYYGELNAQEHMMISDANIIWIIDQLESNRNELISDLNKTYNFGRKERVVVSNLNVVKDGVLCVNCKGRTGFGNTKFDQLNQQGSSFHLYTSDCRPHIVIGDKASLEIGADVSEGGHIGVFHVRKGSVLEFLPGSVLLLHDNSQLLVEEGAELILHHGVSLVLDGSNAFIRMDGILRLKDSCVLSIQSGKSGKKGYLNFRNKGGGYGAAAVITEGRNVKVNLSGNGKGSCVIQIEGKVVFGAQYALEQFKVYNSLITFSDNSLLDVRGESKFDQVNFRLLPWVGSKASSCLRLSRFENSEIVNSIYDNFNIAIDAGSNVRHASLKISNCLFTNCNTSVLLDLESVSISHTHFSGQSEYCILGQDNLKNINLQSIQFDKNAAGIAIQSRSSAKLLARDLDFTNNRTGMEIRNTVATINCCRFLGNENGIKAISSIVNLSTLNKQTVTDWELYGGHCTFLQLKGNALYMEESYLYLDSGGNNFIQKGQVGDVLISGDLDYSFQTHQNSYPYSLKGAGNYWYPSPNQGLDKASNGLYQLYLNHPDSGRLKNLVRGDYLKSVISTCYTPEACNPCDIYNSSVQIVQSVNDGSADSVLIYPQPANRYIQISLPGHGYSTIKLITLTGKLIWETGLVSSDCRLNTENIESRVYMIQIQGDSGIFRRLLQIEH